VRERRSAPVQVALPATAGRAHTVGLVRVPCLTTRHPAPTTARSRGASAARRVETSDACRSIMPAAASPESDRTTVRLRASARFRPVTNHPGPASCEARRSESQSLPPRRLPERLGHLTKSQVRPQTLPHTCRSRSRAGPVQHGNALPAPPNHIHGHRRHMAVAVAGLAKRHWCHGGVDRPRGVLAKPEVRSRPYRR